MDPRLPGMDVAIVGFGFAGLATLAQLVVRASEPIRVAVVAGDASGHGLAYRTRNPGHLLNVPADRMGAWTDLPDDFGRWLRTSEAARCCASLGISAPGPGDYAPRALFACYLDSVRDIVIRHAEERSVELHWIPAMVRRLRPDGELWRLTGGPVDIDTRSCVLATGHEPRSAFEGVEHPDLHAGPWQLTDRHVAAWSAGPVVLIGTGLTAIDALVSVRSLGYRGPVLAFSRSGQLPRPHLTITPTLDLSRGQLAEIDSLASLLATIDRNRRLGHDWRVVLDALRPHTAEIWQRFSRADQAEVAQRWSTVWSVHRHRMAPQLAERISEEIDAGQLQIGAVRRLTPTATGPRLQLDAELADGTIEHLRPAAVIDCTGPELNWTRSRQPLLGGLLADGLCTPHHTGLGVNADHRHQIAGNLYAIGSPLTGQLWESVAVPELRDQAATIGAQLTGTTRHSNPASRSAERTQPR